MPSINPSVLVSNGEPLGINLAACSEKHLALANQTSTRSVCIFIVSIEIRLEKIQNLESNAPRSSSQAPVSHGATATPPTVPWDWTREAGVCCRVLVVSFLFDGHIFVIPVVASINSRDSMTYVVWDRYCSAYKLWIRELCPSSWGLVELVVTNYIPKRLATCNHINTELTAKTQSRLLVCRHGKNVSFTLPSSNPKPTPVARCFVNTVREPNRQWDAAADPA